MSNNRYKSGFLYLLMIVLVVFNTFDARAASNDPYNVRITQVDTSHFPKVNVYVSVTDAKGEPVEVSPAALVLAENGKEIKPEAINGMGDTPAPLTTLLVMDISGSMNKAGKLQAAQDAAQAYVNQTRTNDQIGLLTFNTHINYVQPITQDRQAVLKAIGDLKARDDTAMYDALMEGIKIVEGLGGRKAIIVLTDGMDNRSKAMPQQVIDRIGPSGLSISTIGLGNPEYNRGNLAGLDEAALTYLAEKAGGVYGYANDSQALTQLYERYGRALQSEYIITYSSPSTLRDGVNRALSVTLKGDTQSAVAAQTTKQYNPGGLVPEVAKPASWLLFIGLLIVLVLLLVVPGLVKRFVPMAQKSGSGRIKLIDKTPLKKPKIKLKT